MEMGVAVNWSSLAPHACRAEGRRQAGAFRLMLWRPDRRWPWLPLLRPQTRRGQLRAVPLEGKSRETERLTGRGQVLLRPNGDASRLTPLTPRGISPRLRR